MLRVRVTPGSPISLTTHHHQPVLPGGTRISVRPSTRHDASCDRKFMPRTSMSPSAGEIATLRRSDEHTSELKSLMRISYAVFCLQKKHPTISINQHQHIPRST